MCLGLGACAVKDETAAAATRKAAAILIVLGLRNGVSIIPALPSHVLGRLAIVGVVVAAGTMTLVAQLPIPVQGVQPQAPGQGRGRGRGQEPAQVPDPPRVVSAIATATP